MTKKIALFGVAGSGKTTRCLELIKEFNKNYLLDEISFTTFTRSGITSIKEKLKKDGIILPEENYFRTLHSLCWRLSGYTNEMITKREKKELFNLLKIDYGENESNEDKELGNLYIKFYDDFQGKFAKNIENATQSEIINHLNNLYGENENINGNDIKTLSFIHNEFIKWKKKNNKKMHSDALLNILEKKIDIPVKVLIVDEAQDLFPLQQKIIKMWYEKFEKDIIVLSGDDDQCVHEWAGASPDFLINFSMNADKKIILDKSYRLPKEIANFCNLVLKDIKYREEKTIKTEKDGGLLQTIIVRNSREILNLINENEKTYLLFRTNNFRQKFGDMLFEETQIQFNYLGGNTSSKYTKKFCDINNAINKFVLNKKINYDELKYLIDSLPADILIRGIKTQVKKRKDIPDFIDRDYFFEKFVKSNNLLFLPDKRNIKHFLIKNLEYIKIGKKNANKNIKKNDIIKNKLLLINKIITYSINDKKIEFPLSLGTYHSSKGLEADNVIIFLNTSINCININDEEKRALYVACSRPKKKLIFTYYPNFGRSSEIELMNYVENKKNSL